MEEGRDGGGEWEEGTEGTGEREGKKQEKAWEGKEREERRKEGGRKEGSSRPQLSLGAQAFLIQAPSHPRCFVKLNSSLRLHPYPFRHPTDVLTSEFDLIRK